MEFRPDATDPRTREVEAAFERLDRANAQRDTGLVEMKPNPRFRSLHGDPRWPALLRKMGFQFSAR